MNMMHLEPQNVFDQLRKEMDSVFRSHMDMTNDDASNVVTSRWAPAVDVKEDEQQFTLTADLPGIDPKDIEITMDRGVLSIKGERRHEAVENKKGYQRIERAYGVFHRRFALPETANPEGIRADGRNGVLTITIPKQPQAQPRRIEVQA